MQQLDTHSAEKQISAAVADLRPLPATDSDEELRGGGAEGDVGERRKGRTGGERAPCSRTRDVQGLVQEGLKGSDGGPGTFNLRSVIREMPLVRPSVSRVEQS